MAQAREMVSTTGSPVMVASLLASSSLNSNSSPRSNISVTNIKREEVPSTEVNKSDVNEEKLGAIEQYPCDSKLNEISSNSKKFENSDGIRMSVPKVEDSDESETELADIESANINRRANVSNKDAPRPMSWEGELSDTDDMMDTENVKELPKNQRTSSDERLKQDFEPQTSSESGSNSFCTDIRKFQNEIVGLKYEADITGSGVNSPLLARSKTSAIPANPSPDSAIHSVYTHSSPSQSPLTSRHAPYTPSLSRNNSDASHSSCYSYSSEFSPTHSPIQGRHNIYGNFNGSLHHSVLYRPILDSVGPGNIGGSSSSSNCNITSDVKSHETMLENDSIPSPGISRQQLINSPCPICGDRISGFHYGIFSCESCKGFFKRTVQNRKNYVCVRGGPCPVTISTRKKCPACRFEKCLQKGMKLEAIREDRTRGGRSTYQCSYTLPNSLLNPLVSLDVTSPSNSSIGSRSGSNGFVIKAEQPDFVGTGSKNSAISAQQNNIPRLLQEIMDVEHLWQYNETELSKLNQITTSPDANIFSRNPLLASSSLSSNGDNTSPDIIASLCNVADHRLYKIVKWCKSLPLFKNISIDDQICLLINSWCELLLFSCCFRSMETPGEIKISLGKSITLPQAKSSGLQACIERMLNLTDHLRRLRVDRYEYVAMKVIVLLQSDTSELQEPVKVRESQEKALQALQAYTLAHYPESPAKFGELLLRIPELQKTCQLGKEMLTIKSRDGEDFNLLMELLRGEH